MIKYFIIIFIFLMAAFLIMGLSLYFSRYKKRKAGCCGSHDVCCHSNELDAGKQGG